MKMLKKMAALLLVGVMALALLTACGEDSTPSFGNQVEDAAIKAVNTALGENSALTNDSTLRAQAAQMLEKVNADGKIVAKDGITGIKKPTDKKNVYEITLGIAVKNFGEVKKPDDLVDAMEVTAADLAKLQDPKANGIDDVLKGYNGEIKAIGVATKTLSNGKTYMAMVVTYTVEYGTAPTQPAL